ncbi:hypothetical protein [Thiopseudomonas alkaliphila]|uniref:hypothetical protein n=1 Tax=Thiopseudomonas alkaliphila TaxID=1697053 RepID=UPI0025788262|nr:hypothetical protein [Thiopseudomonas alkaliphila]MDM1716482.1 hypothetical protein [Thiopseudomonas alkaliphila]
MTTPFESRAPLDANPPATEQADYMIFAMQDKHHQFSLGLSTLLECLYIAEQEGAMLQSPDQWWLALSTRYNFVHHQRCQPV